MTTTAARMARFRHRRPGVMKGPRRRTGDGRILRGGPRGRINEKRLLTQRGPPPTRVQAELLAESTSVGVESSQGVVDAADLPERGLAAGRGPRGAARPDCGSKLRQHLGRLPSSRRRDHTRSCSSSRAASMRTCQGSANSHLRPPSSGSPSPRGPPPTPMGRPGRPRSTPDGRRRPGARSRGGSRRARWRSAALLARPERAAARRRRCGRGPAPTMAGRSPTVRRSPRRSAPAPCLQGQQREEHEGLPGGSGRFRDATEQVTPPNSATRHPRPPLVHRPSPSGRL